MASEHWHPFLLYRTERQNNLMRRCDTGLIVHCFGWAILDKRVMGVVYENHVRSARTRQQDSMAVIMDLFCDEPGRTTWENYFLEIAQKRLLEAANVDKVGHHVIDRLARCCINCGASEVSIHVDKSYLCIRSF